MKIITKEPESLSLQLTKKLIILSGACQDIDYIELTEDEFERIKSENPNIIKNKQNNGTTKIYGYPVKLVEQEVAR